jgi:cell division protein FtsB
MLEFQEKRKLRRFLYSRITLIILIIIIALVLKAVWGVYEKQRMTADNLSKAAANFQDLQAREKMLSSEINRLNTVGGTEEEIRDKYGLVKPGEEVITVVDNASSSPNDGSASDGRSFWQKVIDWFK